MTHSVSVHQLSPDLPSSAFFNVRTGAGHIGVEFLETDHTSCITVLVTFTGLVGIQGLYQFTDMDWFLDWLQGKNNIHSLEVL